MYDTCFVLFLLLLLIINFSFSILRSNSYVVCVSLNKYLAITAAVALSPIACMINRTALCLGDILYLVNSFCRALYNASLACTNSTHKS